MYWIRLRNLRFHSHIGVYAAEREIGQNLALDLALAIEREPVDDDLATTVNYGAVYETVAAVVETARCQLVETLGQQILTAVADAFPGVAQQKLLIRKQSLPIDGILDDVEIEMER